MDINERIIQVVSSEGGQSMTDNRNTLRMPLYLKKL